MNTSKSRDPRFWKRWSNSGAVDLSVRAKEMGKAIFGYDPLIGCPFDDSEMKLVEESGGLKVGGKVQFRGLNKIGTMNFPTVRGRILTIGDNAKYLNGDAFVALAIQVGSTIHFKTATDIQFT